MKAECLFAAVLVFAATGAKAQGMARPMPTTPAPSASARSTLPLVDGEVRKIDAAKNFITLKHGELTNLGMPAMTMGFPVSDPKMLAGIKVGQKVKFQAEMVGGKGTVTQLKRVR
ncbi:MAG: heavy metal efflux pump, CzcA family [Rhodoferax sp.]|nr:heavy metal efflux pump, CzcA family [Rhodoferax sp.]